jgi:hypothetical protein
MPVDRQRRLFATFIAQTNVAFRTLLRTSPIKSAKRSFGNKRFTIVHDWHVESIKYKVFETTRVLTKGVYTVEQFNFTAEWKLKGMRKVRPMLNLQLKLGGARILSFAKMQEFSTAQNELPHLCGP